MLSLQPRRLAGTRPGRATHRIHHPARLQSRPGARTRFYFLSIRMLLSTRIPRPLPPSRSDVVRLMSTSSCARAVVPTRPRPSGADCQSQDVLCRWRPGPGACSPTAPSGADCLRLPRYRPSPPPRDSQRRRDACAPIPRDVCKFAPGMRTDRARCLPYSTITCTRRLPRSAALSRDSVAMHVRRVLAPSMQSFVRCQRPRVAPPRPR